MEDQDEQPITFQDLGLTRPETTTDTVLGKARTCSSLEKKEIAFLALSTLSLLGTIGLSFVKVVQFAECKNDSNSSDSNENRTTKTICEDIDIRHIGFDFVFAIVIVLNAVFCIFYVLHGVLRERPYELGIFLISALSILLYAVINLIVNNHRTTIKWIRFGVLGSSSAVFLPVGMWLAHKYNISGNLIFRTIGSNAQLQRACKTVYACFALLKLDAQLALSLVVLIIRDGTDVTTAEIVIVCVGGTFSLLWLSAGFVCLRLESRPLTIAVLLFALVEPGYVIYRMYLAGVKLNPNSDNDEFRNIPIVTLSAGFLALAVRGLLCAVLILCLRNYGLGLKDKMHPPRTNTESQLTDH